MNTDLFNGRYRIDSARLKKWDYGAHAPYFITICTHHMQHFFGVVENDEMLLNEQGKLVHDEWKKTPLLRADMNITLGEFRVMPNHFHAIIAIGANDFNKDHKSTQFGSQSKNLGAIIGGFKSTLTVQIRKNMSWFAWHERYHDHIIRNDEEYQKISQYIINNPSSWNKDIFNK